MEIETDVAVVGAGPCGTTLANLLGRAGVRAVVLDREPDVTPYPRAVAIDDESLRTLQTAGVLDDVLPDLIRNAPIRYHSSTGRVLAHVGPSGRPYGWPRRNLFLQPLLERSLRRGLERFPHVSLHTDTEVTGLETSPDGVRLEAKAGEGRVAVAARYAIGADGGRSFLREAVGVPLEGSTAPSRWLVVDVSEDTLDAPYSAVYCDPDRPTMTIPLPYAHRRFEFKLLPGEDDDRAAGEEFVADLLRRFYPGSLPRVEGRRVYWHHSRIAATFRSGPVFLAGDAAHLQPPFFGQGMNSGIRDATNLAWKLAAVTAGRAGPALLDSYDVERRGHSTAMVSFATRVGSMYQPRSRRTEVVRDGFFRAVQRIPGARDYILQMKYKPAPRYTVGAVVPGPDAGSPVGRQFGQPRMEAADGVPGLLDDILDRTGAGAGPVLAVIGLTADPADHLGTAARNRLAHAGGHLFAVRPGGPAARAGASAPGRSTALVDADGAFRDLLLARPQDEVVVVRPDRYVAAACHAVELDGVLDRLHALLGTPV